MSTPPDPTRPHEAPAVEAETPEPTPAPFPLPPRPRRLPDETLTLPPGAADGAPAAAVQVGRYRIDGEIARGGMGAVLRAHDPDLGRDLALKVLLEAFGDEPELVRRFLAEARVGGQLQHPGVVPVYEVGRCADRRPYFAMKLVEGRTLHQLLKDRATPAQDLPRFLKIFEQVCQATAYAHSKGVIHRDLKPLNVMVGAFGEVQVMDWGLAKVLRGDAGAGRADGGVWPGDPAASRPGSVLGTPAYMAPEQAAGAAGPPDARGDVFGLGAMLCEILTGAPPYRGRDSREVLTQAAAGDQADAFARLDGCGADPELVGLAKACLAADAAARPRDAGAVADAVTAHLAGVQERLRAAEVERAAAKARAEEERKRRRLALALAAAVAAVVLTAGGAWAWLTLERAGRRERADRDVQAALREAAALREKARQAPPDDPTRWPNALAAARRVQGLAAGGDVSEELQGQVRALLSEVEDEARDRRLRTGLEEARLQQAVVTPAGDLDRQGAADLYAAAFREADLDVAALEPEEAADRIRRRPSADDLAAALVEWAELAPDADLRARLIRTADALDPNQETLLGRWRAARAKYLSRAKAGPAPHPPPAPQEAGDPERDALLRLAVAADVDRLPPSAVVFVAHGLDDAGAVKEETGLLRKAQRRRPEDFWINFELAYALAEARPASRDEAIRSWDEAIRFFSVARALRPQSAVVHSDLALALQERGRLAEAEEAGLRALEIQPNMAAAHLNLGTVRQKQGRLDEAEKEYRTVLDLRKDYAEAHADLGAVLCMRGRIKDAEAECLRAVELKPGLAIAHGNLSTVRLEQGRADDAAAESLLAVKLAPGLALAHGNFAASRLLQGRADEAEAECGKALELDPDLPEAHVTRAEILEGRSRLDEADAECRKAIALRPDYALAHALHGRLFAERERFPEAEAECRRALSTRPDYPEAYALLGDALRGEGRFADSLAAFRTAQEVGAKGQGRPYPYAAWVRRAERLVLLDGLLPAVLDGSAEPTDAEARLRFADLCRYKRLFGAAADFAARAFAERPRLAEDIGASRRYNAACAAALAGCGQGADGDRLGPEKRARLRRQALEWLQADLNVWAGMIDAGLPVGLTVARQRLQGWRADPDLAGLRDAEALAKLPPPEWDACDKLWKDVDALLGKAAAK